MKRGFLNGPKALRAPIVLSEGASTPSPDTSATHDTLDGGFKRGFHANVGLPPECEPIEPVLLDTDPSKQVAKAPGVCFEDAILASQSKLKSNFIVQPGT